MLACLRLTLRSCVTQITLTLLALYAADATVKFINVAAAKAQAVGTQTYTALVARVSKSSAAKQRTPC